MTTQQQREAVRTAVLGWLTERASLIFDLPVIAQRVNKSGQLDIPAEETEIADALVFLEGSGFVTHQLHGLGATRFYQATSAGVLAHERGTLQPRPL